MIDPRGYPCTHTNFYHKDKTTKNPHAEVICGACHATFMDLDALLDSRIAALYAIKRQLKEDRTGQYGR